MFEKIISFIDSQDKFQVDEQFIRYKSLILNKIYPENRTQEQTEKDSDGLFLEYILLKNKIVLRPSSWRHDFIYEGLKTDVKRINSKYFNLSKETRQKLIDSINKKELDYFCFYRDVIEYDRPMELSDYQQIKIIDFIEARYVIKNLKQSIKNDGYYYHV